MEQRCTILNLYLNWLILFAGAAFFAATGRFFFLAVWIIGAPVFQLAYIRIFPKISKVMGDGPIVDDAAGTPHPAPIDVTLYTAAGCPFCPIIEERLEALRQTMGFRLTRIDVTARPDLLTAKKIRAIPVVEVGGQLRTGNMTSRELAELIGGAAVAAG